MRQRDGRDRLTGVTAHGLLVYAQRTVQIGSIGVSQVVQPAIAVLWSFLLLGELVRARQALGIAVAVAGLLAVLVLNRPREGGPPDAALPPAAPAVVR